EPNGITPGASEFQVAAHGDRHGPLHVRLTRADPDLPYQHVGHFHYILAADHKGAWGAYLKRFENDFPASLGIGGRSFTLFAEFHRDGLSRIGPAPHRYGDVALQHHVRCEERR